MGTPFFIFLFSSQHLFWSVLDGGLVSHSFIGRYIIMMCRATARELFNDSVSADCSYDLIVRCSRSISNSTFLLIFIKSFRLFVFDFRDLVSLALN